MDIKLDLTLDEVNGIIAVLAQLPFNQVYDLVNKVRNQTIAQVQAMAPTEPEGDAE